MSAPALSRSTADALGMLGRSIRIARLRRRWSVRQLAERVGVSHPTIAKVERGDPGVAIGTVFEAATVVGVPLYDDAAGRARFDAYQRAELALLPSTGRARRRVDDDF